MYKSLETFSSSQAFLVLAKISIHLFYPILLILVHFSFHQSHLLNEPWLHFIYTLHS